jgi:hypothetical protein
LAQTSSGLARPDRRRANAASYVPCWKGGPLAAVRAASSRPADKDTTMKTLLAAAIALIAAPAHAGWLDKWFGSQPAALQCEISITEKHGGTGYNSGTETNNGTWLIKLEGNKWRILSADGSPLSDDINKPSPLRTTDTTYYLTEDQKYSNDTDDFDVKAMTINRVTGELAARMYTSSKDHKWSMSEITTGHCRPSDLAARFWGSCPRAWCSS